MEVRIGSTRASSTTSEQLLNEREIESKNRNETNQGYSDEGSNGCTEISERRSFTSDSKIGSGHTESKSFIGNSTKVTGVQDLISRMRAADSGKTFKKNTVIMILLFKNVLNFFR